MLTSNRLYKTIEFSCAGVADLDTNEYVYLLEEAEHNTVLETNIVNRANFHGGYFGNTLARSRIFTFTGRIVSKSNAGRETAMRRLIGDIAQEGNTSAENRGFYDLERDDDLGVRRTVRARVYQTPQITQELKAGTVGFTFQLASENETIFTKATKTVTGGIGTVGGFTLPTPIPDYLTGYTGFIELNNEGNYQTPVRIRVQGDCVNARIINITNGYNYKLNRTTTDLVVDNTNPSNDPTKGLIVTDLLMDITEFRRPNGGGGIYLSPGLNYLVVLSDTYPSNAVVTVTFRDGRNW